MEGIELDPDNFKPHPGMRALAKLMLNSFWGEEICEYALMFTENYIYIL